MENFNQLLSMLLQISIFILLSAWVFAFAAESSNFLECLSSQIMNTNSTSQLQVIYTPKNSSYSTILDSFIANPRIHYSNANRKPSIIFTPLSESQIQIAIHCSKIHGLQIRVRSGGHDYEGLSYISETTPFAVVDLRNLRSISVDSGNKTAWIQAGATLGEVYYNIAIKSNNTLCFTAGTCPTVGSAGHFSGGGYGMLSRKFGLSVDNIVDARIIDVNGRILDRESMGEDLFWAIRGGGGTSFGIILSWKVKLLDIPEKVMVFNVTRTLEQNATRLVHKWQHIAHEVDENLHIRASITTHGKTSLFQVSFSALFLGGIKQLLREMQESFPELGLLERDCIEMSWIESVLFFAHHPRNESLDVLLNRNVMTWSRAYYKGKSDYVQRAISINGLESIWKFGQNEETSIELQLNPLGGKLNDYSESETPFPHRAGNLFMIHYKVYWEKMGSSKRNLAWARKHYRYMSKYVSKSPRAAYINYRDLDLGVNNKLGNNTSYAQASIWGLKYFKNNFKRLVQVKTKVDPTNFFRNEQSIPPLSTEELSVIMLKPKTTSSKNTF